MDRKLTKKCGRIISQVGRLTAVAAIILPLLACATAPERQQPVLTGVEVASSEELAQFESAGDDFKSASDCRKHLSKIVALLPAEGYGIARGPYPVFENDFRIHAIKTRSGEFVVVEYRCLGPNIEARSWAAGPAGHDPQPLTLDDMEGMSSPANES